MSLCVFLWINFILLLIYLYILMMNRNDLCTSKFSALMETLDTRIIQFPTKNAWLTVFFITVYVWFWFCIFSVAWDFSHFIQFIRLVFKIKFYILQLACKILHNTVHVFYIIHWILQNVMIYPEDTLQIVSVSLHKEH